MKSAGALYQQLGCSGLGGKEQCVMEMLIQKNRDLNVGGSKRHCGEQIEADIA